MNNKDPFGMQRPAQEFKSMLEIQRERADKAERQRDTLAEALREIVECWDGPLYKHEMLPRITKARAALKQLENDQ